MTKTRDPMARDLRTPKYRPRVVKSKKKTIPRKTKHKSRTPSGSSFFRQLPDTHETQRTQEYLMKGIPPVPLDLLEYLESICPDASPSLQTPEREIWFRAGKVDLVRHLRSVFDEQNETILGES